MSSVVIRPATLEDVPTVLLLMTDFNAFEGIPYQAAKVDPALRMLVGDDHLGFIRVVALDGAVVGYVIVTFGFDLEFGGRDAFLTELFVAASARRRGLARKLLETAENDAKDNDVLALHLVVRPENPNAIALYESRGFAVVPRRVMTKRLVS